MHGRADPLGPEPVRRLGALAGNEIDALLIFGQFTARSLPVPGLSTARTRRLSVAFCTVAQPSPGTPRSNAKPIINAEPSGTHERGQIEHSPRPSGTKRCGSDRTQGVRFEVADHKALSLPGQHRRLVTLVRPCPDLRRFRIFGTETGWWGDRELDLSLWFGRIVLGAEVFGLS